MGWLAKSSRFFLFVVGNAMMGKTIWKNCFSFNKRADEQRIAWLLQQFFQICFFQRLVILGKTILPQKAHGSLTPQVMLELASDDQRYTMCVKTQPDDIGFKSGSKRSTILVPKKFSYQVHSCLSFILKSDGKIRCGMVTLHLKSKIWWWKSPKRIQKVVQMKECTLIFSCKYI